MHRSRGNSKRKSDSDSETSTLFQSNSLSKSNLSSNASLTERNNNDSLANDRSRKSTSAVPKNASGSSKKDSKKSTGSSVAASSGGSVSRRGRKPLLNRKEREASVEGDFSCYCHEPYDDTKFYVGCDVCYKWFHGECINIDEKKSKTLDQFVCEDCQDNASSDNKLYCLCREPYDDKQFYICCDKCQDWFHGRCVGVLQSEAKKIDVYICPNCENDSTFLKVNQKILTNEDYDDLTKLLKLLQGNKNSWPFLIPVDSDDVPDYYDIIKSPMDLKTLESKLKERSYKTLSNFVTDAVKIFDNCRYFNPKDSEFYKCADLFEAVFVNKLKVVRDAILERL